MKFIIALLFILLHFSCLSQNNKAWQFGISNSRSSYPFGSFSKLVYKEFNPGFSIGKQGNLFKNRHWVSSLRFNYLYHQHVQHTFSVTAEGGYKFKLPGNFTISPNLGAGVMQAFSLSKVYKLNNEGEYEKKTNFGRTQGLLLLSERLEKKILNDRTSVFIAYQQSMQAPFIKKYVPLLPYNSLLIGISISNIK